MPEDRSLYVCHFVRPIEENFIFKYFGRNQIKRVEYGQYRNKSNNGRKSKRRTIHFAIIVYREKEHLKQVLTTKLLQAKVNKIAGREIRQMQLGDAFDESDSDEDDEAREVRLKKRSHREMMEADGFTVVEQAGQKMASKRKKATDELGETVHGITQEEA